MNIKEALKKRIPRVRCEGWNKKAYIKLPLLESGYGPWAILFDEVCQRSGERLLITQIISCEVVTYKGKPSEAEQYDPDLKQELPNS